MVWMGGEPLLRPDVLQGDLKLFPRHHVTTNGTLGLIELPNCIYVISIDGPPELTLSENTMAITDDCPVKNFILPLYLDGDEFVQPFCCYGNDVDCDLCGAWAVFYLAAKMERATAEDQT